MSRDIEEHLQRIAKGVRTKRQKLTDLERELGDLRAAGWVNASVWMKDGKYMYLVYPVEFGEPRKRQYIGNNPEKMARARARIERYERARVIEARIAAIEKGLRQAYDRLEMVDYLLRAEQTSIWGVNNVG